MGKQFEKAFEAGVMAAINLFKKLPISPKSLAEAAEKVKREVKKATKK